MLVDRALPGKKFVDGKGIALTGLLNAEKTTPNGGNDFGLATDDPSFGIPRGKIGDRERRPIRSDHVAPARSHLLFGHDTQYTLSDHRFSYSRLLLN